MENNNFPIGNDIPMLNDLLSVMSNLSNPLMNSQMINIENIFSNFSKDNFNSQNKSSSILEQLSPLLSKVNSFAATEKTGQFNINNIMGNFSNLLSNFNMGNNSVNDEAKENTNSEDADNGSTKSNASNPFSAFSFNPLNMNSNPMEQISSLLSGFNLKSDKQSPGNPFTKISSLLSGVNTLATISSYASKAQQILQIVNTLKPFLSGMTRK